MAAMHLASILVVCAICLHSLALGDSKEDFQKAMSTLNRVVNLATLSTKNSAKIMYDEAIKADDVAKAYHGLFEVLMLQSQEVIENLHKDSCKTTTELTKLYDSSSRQLSQTFGTFVYNIKVLERGVGEDCDDLSKIVQNLEDKFKNCLSPICEEDFITGVKTEIKNFPAKTDMVKVTYENNILSYVSEFLSFALSCSESYSNEINEMVKKAQECDNGGD